MQILATRSRTPKNPPRTVRIKTRLAQGTVRVLRNANRKNPRRKTAVAVRMQQLMGRNEGDNDPTRTIDDRQKQARKQPRKVQRRTALDESELQSAAGRDDRAFCRAKRENYAAVRRD